MDGDNYEEMKVSLRNNPSPMPQKAKALDALTFEAVGDLGVIKGQGETITLYFNVDVDSLDISSASVTMNAYDVDYPRASERDEVYFNGEHLGRLRGGDNVWHENTFAVPVNAINRGKNTIRINVDVDRIGWITAIGWARLTLKGHAIKLTASDGSEPDGIEVKWTDMGSQYQYALYRGSSKDGPFKQIETVKTNSYFDTAVRYGQPYWYYVEASEIGTKAVQAKSVLRSGVDDGLSKSDGELPRIESIEVAPLWLVGAGQYNLELKWNSFDRKRYEIETITFKASKLRDWLGGYECTVSTSGLVDLFGWPCDFNLYDYKFFSKKDGEGDHGDYLLSVAWSVKDKINGRKYKKGPFYKPQLVNVLFDKYGKHKEGFPNWFYYWTQKDNAIDSKYFSLEAPTYDGKFHYVSNIPMLGNSSGDRVAGSHSDNSHERERFRMPISGYPDLIRLNGECTHQYEISDGAVTEGEIIMQKNGDGYSGPKIGSKETGIAQLSKTIQHELCHGANSDSLYAHKGKWVLGTPDKNFSSYESVSKIVDSIPDKYQNAPYCMLLRALMNSYGADVIILDLDGDKVPDKDEENKVPKLSKTNPDTYNIQARYSIYATCGDNEVLARKAEEMDTVSFNSNHDWAFPGSKFGQNYQGHCKTDLDKEDFLEFKRNSLFLSSSKQSEQYKRSKAQGSILTTEEENREICREVTVEMSSFEIESPNYEIKCSELEVLPQDETGKYQGLYANLEILNYTNDIPVAVECYLYDDSDNPIVETSKAMVLSNGINMVCMKFDGGILSRRGGLGYAVGGIRLLSMQTDCFYYMASSTNKVTTSRTYSSDEFCKPLAYLQKDKFSHAIDDTNLIVYANVISSQDLKNSTIEARLTNTNGLDVAKAYFTGDLWTGTNSCGFAFSGKDILLAHIESPYAFAEIYFEKEGQVVINEPGQLMTIGDVSYKSFSGLSPIRAIEDSFSVLPIKKEFGYVNKLEMSVDITNEFSTATNCIIQASLCDTNGQWICSSSTNVLIQKGVTTATFGFLTSDIYATGIDGPYSVGCIALIVDNDREPSYRWIPNGEPIDVRFSDFGAYPFSVVGTPQYKEATLTNDAAVAVTVDVMRPNTITATALLVNSNGEYVAMAKVVEVVSETGKRTLVLTFDREEIVKSGKRGPYTIAYLVLKSDIEGVEDLKVEDFSVSDVGDSHFVLYVDGKNGDDANSGFSPMKPKRTIQAALDDSGNADIIKVHPGQYAPFVCVDQKITIESFDGPATTIIDGGGTNRCATLSSEETVGTNVVLRGFTLQHGDSWYGGGGALGGTLEDCYIAANNSGGIYMSNTRGCSIVGNDAAMADNGLGVMGGYCSAISLNELNYADNDYIADNLSEYGVTIVGERPQYPTISNSLIVQNRCDSNSEQITSVNLENCTVVDNLGGSLYVGVYSSQIKNSIINGNEGSSYRSTYYQIGYCSYENLCSSSEYNSNGTGLITAEPRFVNRKGRVYELTEGITNFQMGAMRTIDLNSSHIISVEIDGPGYLMQPGCVVTNGASKTFVAVAKTASSGGFYTNGMWIASRKQPFVGFYTNGVLATSEKILKLTNVCTDIHVRAVFDKKIITVSAGGNLQAAIDSAEEGDIIRVAAGTYSPIETFGRKITIESIDGPDVTIIDGEGIRQCAILQGIYGARFSVLKGFTLINGNGEESFDGGGGALGGTLINCVIRNCTARSGGGVANADLYNCVVTKNKAYVFGGGLWYCRGYNVSAVSNFAPLSGSSNVSDVGNGWYYNSIVGEGIYTSSESCLINVPLESVLVDVANGDCRLRIGSAAIDAGDNEYVKTETDIVGASRIQNEQVDIGAYEGNPVDGFVVSVRIEGIGDVVQKTIVIQPGESATIEAVETQRSFLYWQIGNERISNKVHSISNISSDLAVTAVFEKVEWTAEGGGTSLQQAINLALEGDRILVGPGRYDAIVSSNKIIRIESLKGPDVTIIDGSNTNCCAWLGDWSSTNTLLVGFTLVNGFVDWDDDKSAKYGGGVRGGALERCVISNCVAMGSYNCMGGGAYMSTLWNCLITSNQIFTTGRDQSARAYGGGTDSCTLYNCTVVNNSIKLNQDIGFFGAGGGASSGKAYNTIIWGNEANHAENADNVRMFNSCADSTATYQQYGSVITNDPQFVDAENGDYRLKSTSPCRNAGLNAYVTTSVDLLGTERIQDGVVNIGCYEECVAGVAPTVYVNASATGSGDGSSLENGFTSLMDAYNAAEKGSRILVAPGEYAISRVDKILTIKSIEGPGKTIISSDSIQGNRADRWRESNDNLNRATIEGFTLRKGWFNYLNLISCHLEDCSGIGESYLENCIVTRCKNNIYGSKLVGCSVYGSQTAIMGTDHSIIINSIIAVGDEVDPDGIFVNSFVADFTALGAGNTAVDPLFVDAANGDFRLRVGSPCIDAGCVTNTARTTDYLGNPRCLGARPDMGAIEAPAVEGLVVSLRVDGAGNAHCDGGRTKVVQPGESVTIEAVETIRNFLYWQIGDEQISNKVWTITNITADVVATAVFELLDHHVANGDSLQAAIDAAIDRETIYVAPGTYQSIDTGSKNLRIISTDGAAVTVIDGGNTNRCAYLGEDSDGYTALYGFTLTNGFCEDGAGVVGGRVYDSVISNCTAVAYGGGVSNAQVYRSTIVGNKIVGDADSMRFPRLSGGGAYRSGLYNCQVLDNGIICTNTTYSLMYGGGVSDCYIEGCLIAHNGLSCPNSSQIDVYGGGAYHSEIYSCTIVDNTIDVMIAPGETNVVRSCSGAGICDTYWLANSIIYGNRLNGIANETDDYFGDETLRSCIIGTDPGFEDYANGNYRLTEISPAVDRGEDDESDLSVDLDGNPRVSGRAIDAGAYEYQWTSLWCSTTNFVLSGAAQTNSVVFGGSPNYQLVASDDWVELIGTTGIFAVAANTTGAAREGSIIIRGTSGDLVVRIFQDTWKTLPTGIYYGLFVGINNYESGLSSLDGCVSDATNMQNQCVNYGYWRRGKTQALLDGDASKAAIRSALRALAETAQSGDTVLYYHSGHGGNHTDSSGNFTDDVYLCATDANYEDYELADDLSQFKSGVRVIIMIDACHSGGMFKSKGRSAALPAKWNLAERVQQLMAQKRRVAVQSGAKSAASGGVEIGWVTACDSDEYSWDTPSGGEFTGYVLEGWSWFADQVEEGGDGDGYVNFLELANYAAKSATDMTVQRLNDELLVSTIAGVPQETIDSKYLEDALGAADSIAWSGDWLVQMEDAVDGLAAQSAEIGNAETSVLQGEVCGSGILSFKWRVSSEEGKDFLRFGLDGEGLCAISGEADWADVTVNVSGDDWHTLEWTYAKSKGGAAGEDCGRVDCVVWTPVESDGVQEISLGEALGAQGVAWRTTGAAKWCGIRRGFEAYAQTSPLADDQGAALAARLVGPGKLIFEWRVSSEMDCDMLNFSVNGEVKRYISGDTGWTQVRLDLADGTNDVAWVYAKDESGSNGEDRAYLRNVVWTGAALPIATETSTTPVPVPHSWLDQHAAILSAADGDYESAALAVGANGCAVWESFVAGLTPEDESSHFVSTIRFVDGKPVVEWIPALNGVGVREGVRRYTVYGVRNLGEAWQVVPEGGEGAFNFFKVAVELP